MSADELVIRVGLPFATFAWCLASGLVPIINAEIFLVGVAAVTPPSRLWEIVVVATAGQMVAKSVMYLGGRGVFRLPLGWGAGELARFRERAERWRSKDLLVFVSAATGLPPFYVTSILAGTLEFRYVRFLAFGLAGRLVRFSALVAVPPLGRWIAGVGG